jgi:hypothetical protein
LRAVTQPQEDRRSCENEQNDDNWEIHAAQSPCANRDVLEGAIPLIVAHLVQIVPRK